MKSHSRFTTYQVLLLLADGQTDRQTDRQTNQRRNKLKQKHNIGEDNDRTKRPTVSWRHLSFLFVSVAEVVRPTGKLKRMAIVVCGRLCVCVCVCVCGSDRRVSAVNALMIVSNVCTALFRLTTMHRRSACL